MTPAAEARVRAAVAELADALVAALLDAEAGRPDGPPRLLSLAEAADRAGIGRSTLYAAIGAVGDGRLHTVKLGRRRLVPETALAEFLARAERRS